MNDSTDHATYTHSTNEATSGTDGAEDVAWSAHPGQVIYLYVYLITLVLAAIPGIYAPWPWVLATLAPLAVAAAYALSIQCTRYELTDQRLRKTWGILTRHGEEIELYRVEDTSPVAPLLYRLYGRGNVEVLSTDRTASALTLRAIKNHENVRRMIRDRVEAMRRAKGVRLFE